MNKHFCVISHTHWDREWYQPLEQFRYRLVELIDHLLEILEDYPDYIFHLDAQTIVLEDYLQIRTDKKDILKKHIKAGNIIVGPWYVQNDFYLTSGESTVRNLIIGTKLAEEFGACARVGYTPDQFGVMGQLPQILKDFGSDSCIFGRGYTCYLYWDKGIEEFKKIAPPSEFIWEGSDGTKLLGVHMTYWYNNCQRISEDDQKALKLIQSIEDSFEGIATTPYLLLMNGVDHLEPQENLPPILARLNENLAEGKDIYQTTMQQYIDDVKEYLDIKEDMSSDKLTTYKGELRTGDDGNLLQNTFSSHIYLKVLNTKAQNALENELEPLYSFISMQGCEDKYPKQYMDYLWKSLIKNHPHDSICGCSHDHVHNQMESRYESIFDLTDDLKSRGMEFIANHISREGITDSDYIINVCNFSDLPRSGVVEAVAEIPVEESVNGFSIYDLNDNPVPFDVVSVARKEKNFFSPINLPGCTLVNEYKIKLYVENLPAFSVNSFVLKADNSSELSVDNTEAINVENAVMENEFIKAEITPEGYINILDKKTGEFYENVLTLEDTEDTGHAYVWMNKGIKPIVSTDFKPQITKIFDTELVKEYKLTFKLMLPEKYDGIINARSESLVENKVDVYLRLNKSSHWLEVEFDFDNKAEDHRLRALIKTGIVTDYTYSSAPFDVVKRDRGFTFGGAHNGDQPNSGFVNITDGDKSFSVLTEGVYEYNHCDKESGTIAVTLVRGMRGFGSYAFKGQQVLRHINLKIALMPHNGTYTDKRLEVIQKQFQCPMTVSCNPADSKKFSGGRPAVQDSEIKEVFFHKDKYKDLKIGRAVKMFDISGEGIAVTAIKKSENNGGYVIRFYNASENSSKAKIDFFGKAKNVALCNMEETEFKKLENYYDGFVLEMHSKQIISLFVNI